MECRIEKKGNDTLMVLEGELTIPHAGAFKATLTGAMDNTTGALTLDLSKVVDVDLSCLQLLCAAHRTFLKQDRLFSLSPDRATTFTRLVSDSGYARTLGCHKDPNRNCLWKGV